MSRSSGHIILEKKSLPNQNSKRGNFTEFIYNDLPTEVRQLIEYKKYFELAELLVRLEKDGNNNLSDRIMEAINYKSYDISKKVVEIRNDLRKRNYLK
jgi:hypothetical protein